MILPTSVCAAAAVFRAGRAAVAVHVYGDVLAQRRHVALAVARAAIEDSRVKGRLRKDGNRALTKALKFRAIFVSFLFLDTFLASWKPSGNNRLI